MKKTRFEQSPSMIPDQVLKTDVKTSEGETAVQSNTDSLKLIKKYNRLAKRDINSILKETDKNTTLRRSTRKRRKK